VQHGPQFKVYNPKRLYVAACKYAEDAACLVALYGDGASIRWGHNEVVWVEGIDGHAGDSYDEAAALAWARVDARRERDRQRWEEEDAAARRRREPTPLKREREGA
jgi:hypothetical protein